MHVVYGFYIYVVFKPTASLSRRLRLHVSDSTRWDDGPEFLSENDVNLANWNLQLQHNRYSIWKMIDKRAANEWEWKIMKTKPTSALSAHVLVAQLPRPRCIVSYNNTLCESWKANQCKRLFQRFIINVLHCCSSQSVTDVQSEKNEVFKRESRDNFFRLDKSNLMKIALFLLRIWTENTDIVKNRNRILGKNRKFSFKLEFTVKIPRIV